VTFGARAEIGLGGPFKFDVGGGAVATFSKLTSIESACNETAGCFTSSSSQRPQNVGGTVEAGLSMRICNHAEAFARYNFDEISGASPLNRSYNDVAVGFSFNLP